MSYDMLTGLRNALFERSSLDNLPDDLWLDIGTHVTYGTNAIEGSTITLDEARRILVEEVSVPGKPMGEVLETVHHQRAFRSLRERTSRQIDLLTFLELHEQVFRGIKPDAGQWRRVNVRISGSAHSPPRMEKVVPEMEALVIEYSRRDLEGDDAFLLGAWMHSRFEHIHPFSDGNGRVGRLALNLHLMRRNWLPVAISPAVRDEYIASLEDGPEGLATLSSLIMKLEGEVLLTTLDRIGTARDELRTLKELDGQSGYSAKYLSLRAGQGRLMAVKRSGDWVTSERAIELYAQTIR